MADSANLHGSVFDEGAILYCLFLRVGSWRYQIWGEDKAIICAANARFRFRYIA